MCIISHFMSTLGPICIFMGALPLFYVSTWRQSRFLGSTVCVCVCEGGIIFRSVMLEGRGL